MLNIGGPELLIILLVALIFLGPQRLPDVARQLGQTASSLRSLAAGFQAELDAASKPDPNEAMTLDGPTDQAEAIAATQPSGVAPVDPVSPAAAAADPATEPLPAATDIETLKEAARQVQRDSGEPPVSAGGPTDLSARDEEE